jgi:cell division protease FtsH
MWIMLRLARATPGFSGADLAAIINESALGATLAGKEFIEQDDLEEARDKVRFGPGQQEPGHGREKEKIGTAYHEAGHAVVQYLLRKGCRSDPQGDHHPARPALGSTMTLPEKDRYSYSKRWCMAFMKMTFGGRIAEEMFTGDINSGVIGDIRQATGIARKMITEWGMNDRLGFVFYGEDDSKPNMTWAALATAKRIFRGNRQDDRRRSEEDDRQSVRRIQKVLEANKERVDALPRRC